MDIDQVFGQKEFHIKAYDGEKTAQLNAPKSTLPPRIVLTLSGSPNNSWRDMFATAQQYPKGNDWTEAQVIGDEIIVGCPLTTEHIQAKIESLKPAIQTANQQYREMLAKKQAEEKKRASEEETRKTQIKDLGKGLKF